MVTTALIDDAEERLRRAVLANDVKAIGDLLSPALVFTDQTGRRLGKIDSLIAHSSGSLRIRSMTIEDFETRLMGSCAVVTVTASVGGKLDGTCFEARYAYTRIWEASGRPMYARRGTLPRPSRDVDVKAGMRLCRGFFRVPKRFRVVRERGSLGRR